MRVRSCAVIALATACFSLSGGCDRDDAKWEIRREAQHGLAADAEQTDQLWRRYRDDVVRSLDLMLDSLGSVRGSGSVADYGEIDALAARIKDLKRDIVEEIDTPRDVASAERTQLRQSFERIRGDVDAVLRRLGHSPDDIARWQDKR